MKPPAIFITSDETRGIALIEYNLLGLPERIMLSSGEKVVNAYDGRGVKHSTTLLDAAGRTVTKRQYIGDAVIDDGRLTIQLFEGGYLDAAGNPYYYITDWQGNITAVADAAGNIVQSAGYYPDGEPWEEPQGDNRLPFGALFGESSATVLQGTGAHSRHRFEGKERVACANLDFLDFPARPYDPLLLQFWTDDPLCEKYPNFGTRLYCMANPISNIDPTGMKPSEEEAARMAARAYGDDVSLIGGWKESNLLYYSISYTSGLKAVLFERALDGDNIEYALAFAGTQDAKDCLNDVAQVVGFAPQYYEAMDLANEFKKTIRIVR